MALVNANLHDSEAEQALRKKIGSVRRELAALLVVWHRRRDPGLGWVATPRVYAELARAFIEVGAPLLGLEVAAEGLEEFPHDVALRQVTGLALARSGSTEEANRVLEGLRVEGHLEDDTLGVLARTHKDLGLISLATAARGAHLDAALRLYGEAYARSRSYWTGINVATLAVLRDDRDQSTVVASQVMADCRAELDRLPADHPDRYWVLATLGEAALSMGDWAQAEDWYRQAGERGRRRFGDLNSTRRHARLLTEHFGRDPGVIDQWLPLPRVVVFSGHMIDRPDRAQPRFPPHLEHAVYAAIRDWLARNRGLIGFSSAASGGDLLFLEAIQELGGETHVILPYHQDEFLVDSVDTGGNGGNGDWRARFEAQLAASRVVYASSSRLLDESLSFDYANHIVHGLGRLRAGELETELVGLAVWDGQAGGGLGGTASAVQGWQERGVPVHRVPIEQGGELNDEALDVQSIEASSSDETSEPPPPMHDTIMALLFADAVGFSQLTDREVPLFVEACLGLVAGLIDRTADSIPVRETWGDGLFLAFTSVHAAGVFALELREAMAATDWVELGFNRPLSMRFALHAGPVHLTTDPITRLAKCCGTHVSRAARLEPKTPVGEVYASEAFAALAAREGITAFRCDYVKQLDWAKRYGTFPAYVVRRQAAG